jgi:DNA-binding winged helix-turn-helix (wHTH) protein/tetratricopeptide (TPR) repeat protein
MLSALPGAPETDVPATALAKKGADLRFSFAGFRLEADGSLFRGNVLVHLAPKELAALRLLLENAGQIVSSAELRKELWEDVHVTADSIPKCVSSLRARLEPGKCIETVYKRGYRFIAEVTRHGGAQPSRLPRLAIIPFSVGLGVPAHLGLSIAEEAIARLSNSGNPAVSILARDSVFTLTERGFTAHEVGESLKGDLVLTGSLFALPSHFRLRVEMIRVEDGTQIWVEDLLVAKDRIAGLELDLVSRIHFRVGGGGLDIAAAGEQENLPRYREAYEVFQRARYEWQSLERHRMQDGVQQLSHAAELDPSLIGAKVELVRLCVTQSLFGFMSPAVAADLVHRTTKSIPDFSHQAEAILPVLGWVNFHWDRNLPAALWAFSLSSHLPSDTWATRMRATFALSRHRFGEAIELMQAALRDDPYSPWLHSRLTWAFHLDGQADKSMEQVRRDLSIFPDHESIRLHGAMVFAFNGDAAAGTQLVEPLAQHFPSFDVASAVHAYTLACEGRADEARDILERLQWMSRERFVLKSFMPAVYVVLGDHDAALSELKVAGDARCPWFFQMLADPRLKALRGRREFAEMRAILTGMEAAAALESETESESQAHSPKICR